MLERFEERFEAAEVDKRALLSEETQRKVLEEISEALGGPDNDSIFWSDELINNTIPTERLLIVSQAGLGSRTDLASLLVVELRKLRFISEPEAE